MKYRAIREYSCRYPIRLMCRARADSRIACRIRSLSRSVEQDEILNKYLISR